MDRKQGQCHLDRFLCPSCAQDRVPSDPDCEAVARDRAVLETAKRASLCLVETQDESGDGRHDLYRADTGHLAQHHPAVLLHNLLGRLAAS